MPKYDSPLGSKRIAGQTLKEFDVPDDSGEVYPVVRQHGKIPQPPDPTDIRAAMAYRQQLMNFVEETEEVDENQLELEREIKAAREAKRTGRERLNEGAKRRIEMLVGMTRSIREVDVEGNIFVFQSLRSKEMREAIMSASEFDGTVQSPFEVRRQLLARSLIKVANVDISHFVGSDSLDAKLQLIDDLDEALLNRLYQEYLNLVTESRAKFSIKTADDVKEIAEDLKK